MKKSEKKIERKESYQNKPRNNGKVKIIFSSITLVLAILFELFFILNFKSYYEAIAAIAFIIIIVMYILVSSILNEKELIENERSKQYEDLFKSEKASYLLIRKNYQEIEEKLIDLEKRVNSPNDEIVQVQKNLTKLILTKNIENTKTLAKEIESCLKDINIKMENLIAKGSGFDSSVENIKDSVITKIELLMNEHNKELSSQLLLINKDFTEKQQQIINQTNLLLEKEKEIVNNINGLSENFGKVSFEEQIEVNSSKNTLEEKEEVINSETEEINADQLLAEDSNTQILETSSDDQLDNQEIVNVEELSEVELRIDESINDELIDEKVEDIDLEELKLDDFENENPENILFEELKPIEEETIPKIEVSEDPNKKLSAEEIAAMFASVNVEDNIQEEPLGEDVEEEKEETPIVEVSGDPNKQLSAEEIAAMFASVNVEDNIQEEPLEEDVEEEKEETPIVEVSGDPNKQLSPEEIAALFASVQ